MEIFKFQEYNQLEKLLRETDLYNPENQEIVYNLAKRMRQHVAGQPELKLEIAFQSNINRLNAASKVVDIVALEKFSEKIKIAVNICPAEHLPATRNRYSLLQPIHQIDEVFIYDYEKDYWLGNNGTETSYSLILGAKLANLLEA